MCVGGCCLLMGDSFFLESLGVGGMVLLGLWVNLGLCLLFSLLVVGLFWWRLRKHERSL